MTSHHTPPDLTFGTALSLIAPGAGHVLVGERGRGLVLLSASFISFTITWLSAFFADEKTALAGVVCAALWILIVHVFAMIDFRRAARAEGPRAPGSSTLVTAVAVLGMTYPCVLAVFARENFLMVTHVPTGSMSPTIASGDHVLVNRWAARRAPRRGDIVVFRAKSGALWIKRVIGLPGDRVEERADGLWLNGAPLGQADVEAIGKRAWNVLPVHDGEVRVHDVPAESCFVVGDNRRNSLDSRALGSIDLANIVGIVHR